MVDLASSFIGQQARRSIRNRAIGTLFLILLAVWMGLAFAESVEQAEWTSWFTWVSLVVLILSSYGVVRNTVAIVRALANPYTHWIVHYLARYGSPLQVIDAIESELRASATYAGVGNSRITSSWLLVPETYGLKAIPLRDVVWAYKRVVKHKAALVITIQKDYAAIIHSRSDETAEISGPSSQIDEFLAVLAQRVPHAVLGYDEELEKLWNQRRDSFLAEIDQRLQALDRGPSSSSR